MKTINHIFAFAAVILMFFSSCFVAAGKQINIIPQPSSVEIYDGECNIAGAAFKVDKKFGKEVSVAVNDFAKSLETVSGVKKGRGVATVVFKKSEHIAKEGYSIEVSKNQVVVNAADSFQMLFFLIYRVCKNLRMFFVNASCIYKFNYYLCCVI